MTEEGHCSGHPRTLIDVLSNGNQLGKGLYLCLLGTGRTRVDYYVGTRRRLIPTVFCSGNGGILVVFSGGGRGDMRLTRLFRLRKPHQFAHQRPKPAMHHINQLRHGTEAQ